MMISLANLLILIAIGILLLILLFSKMAEKRVRIQEEHDELMQLAREAHYTLMKKIQEEKEKDVASLYPIGSLIPKRKSRSDDTGPR